MKTIFKLSLCGLILTPSLAAAQSGEDWAKPAIRDLSQVQSPSVESRRVEGQVVENVIDWPVQIWPIGTNPTDIPHVDAYRQVVDGLNDPKFFQVRYGYGAWGSVNEHDGSTVQGDDSGKKAEVIGVFQRKAAPIRLSVLIEAGGELRLAGGFLSDVLKEILNREMRPEDTYNIATYDESDPYHPYTGSVSNIAPLFKSFSRKPGKAAPLFVDAVAAALNRMDAQKAGNGNVKKILFVICQGSKADEMRASGDKGYALRDQVIHSDTQIVIVRVTDKERWGQQWDGAGLASLSGGLVFQIDPFLEMKNGEDAIRQRWSEFSALKELYYSLKIDRRVRIALKNVKPGSITPIYMEVNAQLPETRLMRNRGNFRDFRLCYPKYYFAPASQSGAS